MSITKIEQNLITKYYSIKSNKKIQKRIKLQEHVFWVESISDRIISLYNNTCDNIAIDRKISDIETKSVKYACLFHDIGKTVKWKIDGNDKHIEKGIEIISSTEFKKDFGEIIGTFPSEDEIDETLKYIMSAIQLHKSFCLDNKSYLYFLI